MVGGHQGVGEAAGDGRQSFREAWGAAVQEHVELGVGGAVTSEVVVGGVVEFKARDGVFGEDVVEEVGSGGMVRVDISVTSEVDGCAPVLLGEGGEDGVKDREGEKEVSLAAAGGEVEADVDGRGESGDVEEDGEDCRGCGGQHRDKGVLLPWGLQIDSRSSALIALALFLVIIQHTGDTESLDRYG